MNQTIELTQDELALAILDLQNWRCPECEQGARTHYREYPPRLQLGKILIPCPGKYGLDFDSLPDATRSIAAAMDLFFELPTPRSLKETPVADVRWQTREHGERAIFP